MLLRFDEPVETAFGAIRVYDAQARRVDAGKVERPRETEARVALDRRLARGTYTATWRAVSADGHPISGAFVFHVGAPGANPAGIAAQVLESGTPASVSVLFSVVRALDFLLLLLVGGGTLLLITGLGGASSETQSRLSRLLAGLSLLLAVVALAGIVLQGAAAGGFGLREALHWDVVSAVVGTRFGTVWLAQAALAVTCAALLVVSRTRAGARVDSGSAAVVDTVPVRARKRVRRDRARGRRRARHRRRSLGRRSRGARACSRLGRNGAVGARRQRRTAVLGSCGRRGVVADRQRHRQRLPAGPGAPRTVGDHLRTAPARQDHPRPAAARARPLQQPPRGPAPA